MNTENFDNKEEEILKALAKLEKVEPTEELEEKIYNRLDPRILLQWFSFSKGGTLGMAMVIVLSLVFVVTESYQRISYIYDYKEGKEAVFQEESTVIPASEDTRSLPKIDKISRFSPKVKKDSVKVKSSP